MEQRNSEWLRTLVSVMLGFTLAAGWQAYHDSRIDTRNRNLAVVLLKSRVANDVFFTKAVIDGFRKGGAHVVSVTFFPQPEQRQVEGLGLLAPDVIKALDHYDKVVTNLKSCRDFVIANSSPDPVIASNRAKVIATCFDAFVVVGEDFLTLLDKRYPDIKVPRTPSLGTSYTVQ